MKYVIVLFLLLGCTDEIVIYKNCFNMTIPKGNPIKFWLNGEESFNSVALSGMQEVCFCGRWALTDNIRIQVVETVYSALTLKIWNSNDEEVGSVDFTETSDIFDVNFTLTGEGVTDSKIYFTIVVSAPTMAALSTWTNRGDSPAVDWTLGSNPSRSLSTSFGYTKFLSTPFNGLADYDYSFNYNFDITGYGNLNYFKIALLDADLNEVYSYDFTPADIVSDGNYSGSVTLSPTSDFAYLAFYFGVQDALTSVVIDINSVAYTSTPIYAPLAESDCFLVDDEDTVLIQYGDKTNYAEIDYTAQQIYSIRLAGRFVKERTQEENESDQTSDGAVEKLSSTLKDQKLLEIEYAPPYIHKLMKRVLNHNTIYIDGEYWVKEENYEARDVSNSQPLQPATCWLTQKEDGYNTNVYGTLTNI